MEELELGVIYPDPPAPLVEFEPPVPEDKINQLGRKVVDLACSLGYDSHNHVYFIHTDEVVAVG
jgi:hypothetical protein